MTSPTRSSTPDSLSGESASDTTRPAPVESADEAGSAGTRTLETRWGYAALLASLPGLTAGLQLTGLLFFLNPQLPFAPTPWLRAALYYGSVLAMTSVALILPLTRGSVHRARRALPWTMVIVFVVSAIGDWYHASAFAYYLPPGINRRLIKAAVGLSVAAVIAFYTALLHSLHRRRYGWRSRAGFVMLTVLSIYLIVERREAFQPPPEASPRPSMVEASGRPNLVVVGVEAATLDAILPMAQQGELPFLSKMIETGSYGRLLSIPPSRREALWATFATGKLPYKHGVLGDELFKVDFIAPGARLKLLPLGLQFARWGTNGPETTAGDFGVRASVPAWEVLTRLGVETAVVGWPASEPLSPGLAAGYSERALSDLANETEDQVQALELGRRFGLTTSPTVKQSVARDHAHFRRAIDLLPNREHDPGLSPVKALFVALPGLAEVSRETFGGYWAVQFEGSQGRAEQEAARTLASYYAFIDDLLSQLWAATPEPRLLLVTSPFGVRSREGVGRLWSRLRGEGKLEASTQGAPDGVFLMRGEGVANNVLLNRPRVVDAVPTLLYSLGLPLARDFDGRLITQAFSSQYLQRTPLTFVPSYETLTRSTPSLRRDAPDNASDVGMPSP